MVAVFTGLGAGFERGSGSALGSAGFLGASSFGRAGEGVFLNAASGNLMLSRQDEFLVGRGPDVAITRTYNSVGALDENGDHWRQSTDRRVIFLSAPGTQNSAGTSVKRVSADGSEIVYTWNGSLYVATDGAGAHDTLAYQGGDWLWTDGSSRLTELYRASHGGWISEARDTELTSGGAHENIVLFDYVSAGKLDRVRTADGSSIKYVWNAGQTHIDRIETYSTGASTPTLTRTHYEYDGSERLIKVRVDLSPENNTTAAETVYEISYTYHGASKRIATISQSDGSSLAISYDELNRVTQLIQTVSGAESRYTTINYHADRTEVFDGRGQVTKLFVDAAGQLVKAVSPPANSTAAAPEVQYAYDAAGNVTQITSSAGAVTRYVYDVNGNAVRTVDAQGNAIVRLYDSANRLIQEASFPGNLLPNPGVYPKSAYSSTSTSDGNVSGWYAWTNDADGGHIHGLNAIAGGTWLYNGEQSTFVVQQADAQQGKLYDWGNLFTPQAGQTYVFSAYTGAHRADVEVFFVWKGANGEYSESRGASAQSQNLAEAGGGQDLSGYKRLWVEGIAPTWATEGYAVVRKLSTKTGADSWMFMTRPQLELKGETSGPSAWTGAPAAVSRLVYDAEGHLRYSISAEGRVNEFRYAATGELQWSVQYPEHTYAAGFGVPSETQMNAWRDGLGDRSSVMLQKYEYDGRGNLTRSLRYGAASGAGASAEAEGYSDNYFTYNLAGQLLARNVGSQAVESFVYDGLGRLILSTDLAGGTSRIVFNDAATTTTVTTNLIQSGGVWVESGASYTTTSVYNKAGDLLTRTDAGNSLDGAFTTGGTSSFAYDKTGQLRMATDATNRRTYFIYDKAGRKIAEVGHDGQLTEFQYDVAGRVVATARYWNKLSAAQLTTLADPNSEVELGSVGFPRPAASNAYDIWQWSVYDQLSRVVQTIDGSGAVTTYEYDHAGRLAKAISYFNKLASVTGFKSAPPAAPQTVVADPTRDRVERSFHDKDGRLIGALNGEGALSRIVYDGAGRKVQELAFANVTNSAFRANGAFEQLLSSFSADGARDTSVRYVYDGQGLLRYTVDALNRVTEFVYEAGTDGLAVGLVRKTIVYSSPIAVLGDYRLTTVRAAIASHADDRVTYAVYNARGQREYSVDAMGAVTRFAYDASGRAIKVTRFAVAYNVGDLGTDAQWLTNLNAWAGVANNNVDARVTRNYYGERGDLRATVDAAGFVTWVEYDQQGRIYTQHRYATAIVVSDATKLADVATADKGASVQTNYRYDNLGRLQDVYDGNWVRRSTVYHANGMLGYEIEAWGQGGDERRVVYYYDQAGRLLIKREIASEVGHSSSLGVTATLLTQAQRIASANGNYSAVLTRDGELRIYHKGEIIWASGTREDVANASYRLVAQTDGNLVLYRDVSGQAQVGLWSSNTAGAHSGATFLQMGDDGNLTFHKGTAPTSGGQIWQSSTANVVAQDPNAAEHLDTVYTYDGLGNVATVRDTRNFVTSFTYDKVGRVKTQTNPLSGIVSHEYDTFGRAVRTTDASGAASYAFFDKAGRVVSTVDREGYVTRTTYTAFGEIATVTRHSERATNVVSITAPPVNAVLDTGATTTFAYDKLGRLSRVTDAEGGYEHFTLNAFGERRVVRNKLGGETTYTFDLLGRTVLEKLPVNSVNAEGVEQAANVFNKYEYDARGNLTKKIEAFGLHEERTTIFEYDAGDRLIRKKDETAAVFSSGVATSASVTPTEEYFYDRRGNLIEKRDAAGARTLYYFDKLDRLTHQVTALGAVTRYFYDKKGNVAETRAYETRLTVLPDHARGLPPTTSGAARITKFSYDALDRMTEKRTPGVKTASYDGSLSITTQDLVTTYLYDAVGNLTRVTDANGKQTNYAYDKLGRRIAQLDPANYRTDWTYDADGNVLSERRYAQPIATTANANILRGGDLGLGTSVLALDWTTAGGAYAAAIDTVDGASALTLRKTGGEMFSWAPPNYAWAGAMATAGGDGAGGRFSVTAGETIGYAIEVKELAAGLQIWSDIVFYDAAGQAIAYSGFNQVDANNWERSSTSAIVPENAVYAVVRLGSVRIDSVTNAAMDFAVRKLQVHKLSGGASGVPAWSAPVASADDRVTTFIYDRMGRRVSEMRSGVKVHDGSGGYAVQDSTIRYQYNALGQVTRKTEANGDQINYAYDAGGRMTSEARAGFVDFNGTTVTPTVDYYYSGLDALSRTRQRGVVTGNVATETQERITRYTYDTAGRLEAMTDAAGFKRTYRYDATGRVTREEYNRLDLSANPAAANEAIGYEYDLEGRAIKHGALVYQSGAWTRTGANIDTVTIRYNAFGEVSERGINDVYGERFDYDLAGRLWRTTMGDGGWKYSMFDKVGNATLAITSTGANIDNLSLGAVLNLWSADPDSAGAANNIVLNPATGVVATITRYDARNLAVEVVEPERERTTTVRDDLVTSRAYNAFGEVAHEINANLGRVDYSYNTMGRLVRSESPEVSALGANGKWITGYSNNAPQATSATEVFFRPVEQRYYDISGRLVGARDANGNLTRLTLLAGSGHGNSEALVRVVTSADGSTVTTGYDIHGDGRKNIDQLGRVTTQSFDRMGRLIQVEKPTTAKDYYRYDGLGLRIRHWNSLYNPTYNAVNDPNGLAVLNAETTTYDHQGRIVQQVAMGGDTTTFAYAWSAALATSGMGQFGGWTQTTTYANGKTLTEQTDVFGRALSKIDLGAHTTGYVYDKAGRLVQRTGGQTLSFDYYNTGRVKENYIHVTTAQGWNRRATHYGYDKVGNLLTEKQTNVGVTDYWTQGWWENIRPWDPYEPEYVYHEPEHVYSTWDYTYSNSTATYDALGRMLSWSEAGAGTGVQPERPPASITYKYDANGNIRRSTSTFRILNQNGAVVGNPVTQDYWYAFDSLNRVVTQKGTLVGESIVRGVNGIDLFYDAAGQRRYTLSSFNDTYTTWEEVPAWPESQFVEVTHSFSNTRREDYTYDAGGRLTQVNVAQGYYDEWSGTGTTPTAAGGRRASFAYDLMDRMTSQIDYEANGTTVAFSRALTYNAKSQLVTDVSDTRRANVVYRNSSTFNYGTSTGYALGAALTITTGNYQNGSLQTTSLTTNTYQWWDGAVQQTIAHKPNQNQSTTHTTTYAYNQVGGQAQLTYVNIQDGRPRYITFQNDLMGQVMRRDEQDNSSATNGDPHEVYYRFGGKQMGYLGNNGSLGTDYAQSIANRTATSGTGAFRNGANGAIHHADFDQSVPQINSYFQGSSGGVYTVQSGDTLQSIAARTWGDASLWWKLAEANGLSGDSALTEGQTLVFPTAAIKNTHNASTFTPYDAGGIIGDTAPTTPVQPKPKKAKCGGLGAIILAVIAIAVTIVTAGAAAAALMPAGTTLGAGIAAVATGATGLTATTLVGIGAASAAAGSVVSQIVGVATGIQDKFSWSAVALAAIGGGVGAGVGLSGIGGSGWQGAAVRGALSSAITQGIGVATGLQDKFSWAGVAVAGVAAGVSKFAADRLPGAPTGDAPATWQNTAASSAAGAIAGAATRSLIEGSDFGDNLLAALPDVVSATVGQLINNSAIAANPSTPPEPAPPAAVNWNESIPELDAMAAWAADMQLWIDAMMSGGPAPAALGWRHGSDDLSYLTGGTLGNFVDTVPVVPGEQDAGGLIFILDEGRSGENITSRWILPPDATGALRVISDGTSYAFYTGQHERTYFPEFGLTIVRHMPVTDEFVVTGQGRSAVERRWAQWEAVRDAGRAFERDALSSIAREAPNYIPIVGDILAIQTAYRDPTLLNIGAAAIGLIPILGDGASAIMRGGARSTRVLDDASALSFAEACFVAGTMIHTKEGMKPIEAIEAGDWVLAQPEMQGERAYRQVLRAFQREDQEIWSVTIVRGGRRETLNCTSEHPFWVAGQGWTGASELYEGQLVELTDGGHATVSMAEKSENERQRVFNFAVEGFHTYYVGELGVWVHNACNVGDIVPPARTNYDIYEVLVEQPITGTTRPAHRRSANEGLMEAMEADADLARILDIELGADVMAHMRGGAGAELRNPPGAVWHHPVENPGVMRLLRVGEHTNPRLQPVLHPGGVGGYGTHYGGG